MSTRTEIANLALFYQGISQTISNIELDHSREAETMKAVWAQCRDYVLRDIPWPFARRYAQPGLVAGDGTTPANPDWMFAYRTPSDCLNMRRIVTTRGRRERNPPPYGLGGDDQGELIFCNIPQATIEYTRRVLDEMQFDPIFVSMFAWRLALITAPSLGRMPEIVDKATNEYEAERTRAGARAHDEEGQEEPREASWIEERQ